MMRLSRSASTPRPGSRYNDSDEIRSRRCGGKFLRAPAWSLRLCAEPQMRSSGEIWMGRENKFFRAGKRYLIVKRILAVLPLLTTLMMQFPAGSFFPSIVLSRFVLVF